MEPKMNLPEDDVYAILAYAATDMTSEPENGKQSQVHGRDNQKANEKRDAVAAEYKRLYGGISVNSDEPDSIIIHGKEYKVALKEHNKKTGFQAIVFKHPDKDAYILAVGGSYPAKKPFSNPREWRNDWLKNNLLTGVGIIPEQFDSLRNFLDDCKQLEINITEAVGFSQGSISLGLALMLNDNSHIKGYLYNGGAPRKLVSALEKKYEGKVNTHPTNFITMVSKDEPLSRLLYWVKGAGTYLVTSDRPDYAFDSGHPIITHFGLRSNNYKAVIQCANAVSDSLQISVAKGALSGKPEIQLSFDRPNLNNSNAIASAVYQLAREQFGDDAIKYLNFKVRNNGITYDFITEDDLDDMSKKLGIPKEELINANNFNSFKKGSGGVVQLIKKDATITVPSGTYKGKVNLKQLKKKSFMTGGAAPVKSSGSEKDDGDGHWITTKNGNHIFIEDELPVSQGGFIPFDPKGMAYTDELIKASAKKNKEKETDYGLPEVFYSNVSPEVLEVRNDPEMIAYLSRNERR